MDSKQALRAQLNPATQWRKSTKSGPYSDNCVEIAALTGGYAVRDTTDRGTGPTLFFTDAEWDAFVVGASEGEFSRS